MAGLLVRELKLRGLVERILVVCPANLAFQWQRELKEKFDEKFEVIKGDVDFPQRDRIRFDLDTTVAKHVKMAASKIRIRANTNLAAVSCARHSLAITGHQKPRLVSGLPFVREIVDRTVLSLKDAWSPFLFDRPNYFPVVNACLIPNLQSNTQIIVKTARL
jgi:hypothetical protein